LRAALAMHTRHNRPEAPDPRSHACEAYSTYICPYHHTFCVKRRVSSARKTKEVPAWTTQLPAIIKALARRNRIIGRTSFVTPLVPGRGLHKRDGLGQLITCLLQRAALEKWLSKERRRGRRHSG
jgi:hypothetical protein